MKSEVAERRYGENSYFTILVYDSMQYITLFPTFQKNLPVMSQSVSDDCLKITTAIDAPDKTVS
jgi:hypothetical protein